MHDATAFLYRLFAPLAIVVLIIAGVDLGTGLLKNSQQKQTALTVAHAMTCVQGFVPASPCPPPQHPYPQVPCQAKDPIAGTILGMCVPTGCCLGTGWPSAGQSAQSQGLFGDLLKGLIDKITQQSQDSSYQSYDKAPVCTSLTATPTLINPGESTTLTWMLDGGTPESTIVLPGVGLVSGYSVQVKPADSTTYSVTVRNRIGNSECKSVRVYVGVGPNGETVDEYHTAGNTGDDSFDLWGNEGESGTSGATIDDIIWGATATSSTPTTPAQNTDVPIVTTTTPTAPAVTPTQNYYVGGAEAPIDWSQFSGDGWETVDFTSTTTNDASPSFGNVQVQPYGDGDIAENTSGFTESELYGVWNRPQSPTTGGFGMVSGGTTGGTLDFTAENPSIFARFMNWVRSIFCFWCNTSAYLQPSQQLANGSSAFVVSAPASFGTTQHIKKENYSIELTPVTEQGTKIELYYLKYVQSVKRHNNGWFGSWIESFSVQFVDSRLTGYEPNPGGAGMGNEFKLSTIDSAGMETTFSVVKAVKYKPESRNLRYKDGWTELDLVINDGKEHTFVTRCDAEVLTIRGADAISMGGTRENTHPNIQTSESDTVISLHNTQGPMPIMGGRYYLYCGTPAEGTNDEALKKAQDTKETCDNRVGHEFNPQAPEGQRCKPIAGGGATQPPAPEQPCPTGQARVGTACQPTTMVVGSSCVVAGTGAPGIAVEQGGAVICQTSHDVSRAEQEAARLAQEKEAQDLAARKALEEQKAAYEARLKAQEEQYNQWVAQQKQQAQDQSNQQNGKIQQAMQQADQQRAAMEAQQKSAAQQAQQKASAQQQAQQDAQKKAEQNWLQQMLSKVQGATQKQPELKTKPVCKSFTVSDTSIKLGEAVALSWEVEGARKIVLRPKVEVVTASGKTTGTAKPTSDTAYTLVASNQYGETSCETDIVRVADPVCETASLHIDMSVSPSSIKRPSCDPEETTEACDTDWKGEDVTIAWEVTPAQCVASCSFLGPDGLLNDSPDSTYELTGLLRKTSTFKLSCVDKNDKHVKKEVTATVK